MYASEDGEDWIEALRRCVEDPAVIYDYVIRLVEDVGCDGLRLFVKSDPVKVRRVGNRLVAVDPQTGERTGCIDTLGGGGMGILALQTPVIQPHQSFFLGDANRFQELLATQ